MKTWLDYMMAHESENLGWCKPHTSDDETCTVAVNEGKICSILMPGLNSCAVTEEQIEKLARNVNPDYDDYDGYDDTHIALDAMRECGCASCPWRAECDAMAEPYGDDDDDDDETDEIAGKYFIVDCNGNCETSEMLETDDRTEAIKKALTAWDRLTLREKKNYAKNHGQAWFYLGFAPEDKDAPGYPVFDRVDIVWDPLDEGNTVYLPKDGIDPDSIYGSEDVACLPEFEIIRLSAEWGTDVMEQMREATPDEVREFGIYRKF